jgi:UDP-glucose 4-epimerase
MRSTSNLSWVCIPADWAVARGGSLIVGDCGDQSRGALTAEHRIETIVHFAASIVVPDSVHDPLGCNTVSSHALIETAVTIIMPRRSRQKVLNRCGLSSV